MHTPPVAHQITRSQAIALVCGRTGKPGGVNPTRFLELDSADTIYLLGELPVAAFIANEAGARYDGTVDLQRAQSYAAQTTAAPPVIAGFGRRDFMLRIHDGGHRLTAARLNQALLIPAIVHVRASQWEALQQTQGTPLAQQGWSIEGLELPRLQRGLQGPSLVF